MQLSHVLYFDIKGHFWVTSAAFIACSATVVLIPVEAFYLDMVVLNRKYSVWRVCRNGAVCVTSIHISHSGHRWHDSCMTGSYFDWLLFAAKRHAHRGGGILVSMDSCQAFLPFSPLFPLPPPPPAPKSLILRLPHIDMLIIGVNWFCYN